MLFGFLAYSSYTSGNSRLQNPDRLKSNVLNVDSKRVSFRLSRRNIVLGFGVQGVEVKS